MSDSQDETSPVSSAERRAQLMERIAPLSDADRMRRDVVPFHATKEQWAEYAASVRACALHDYKAGELTLRRTLEVVLAAAFTLPAVDRVLLLGATAAEVLQTTRPKGLNRKRPPYPEALKQAAVDLIIIVRNDNPADSLREVVKVARDWLTTVQLFSKVEPPTEETLYRWYLKRARETGQSRPRGRPRRDNSTRSPHPDNIPAR